MATSSLQRAPFEPDGASLAATAVRDQAVSSAGALARFEFEAGKGNEGTKILMIEWIDEEDGVKSGGNWEVSWEGKSTILNMSERDIAVDGKTHRLYFLLEPGISVPPIVKIAQVGGKTMQTNPLPAIFPPQLGSSARAAGKKGVLHTIWGKKRLSVLQREIDREIKAGNEGIGLDLAIKEREWIEDYFGIGSRYVQELPELNPSSPRSPGGGRLAERMKGLKLATSHIELSPRIPINASATTPTSQGRYSSNPLSPETGDVAVSSFALFHGGLTMPRRAVAQTPPDHIIAQQAESESSAGMASLTAVADSGFAKTEENENDEGLFAVTLSPRSPEMTTSPFSFTGKDVWVEDR